MTSRVEGTLQIRLKQTFPEGLVCRLLALVSAPLSISEGIPEFPFEPSFEKQELAALLNREEVSETIKESLPFTRDLLVNRQDLIEDREILRRVCAVPDEPLDLVKGLIFLLHQVSPRRFVLLESGEKPDRLFLLEVKQFDQADLSQLLDPLPPTLVSGSLRLRKRRSKAHHQYCHNSNESSLHIAIRA